MTLGHPVEPGTIEALTGSAFGYQRIGSLTLFDPPGWDPDLGVDQALVIMGIDHQRLTFPDAQAALAALRDLVQTGPVFVGPLDMGLLLHQSGSDRPSGADHFVAVLHVDAEYVVMHDPQGHPFAALPVAAFMAAWGSDTIAYAEGQFPLRTNFTVPRGTHAEWAEALVSKAAAWAGGEHAIPGFPEGNANGLRELADEIRGGQLTEPTPAILAGFALRLGARRRADTADLLETLPNFSALLRRQAELIGSAQLAVVQRDWDTLASHIADVADLHEAIVAAL